MFGSKDMVDVVSLLSHLCDLDIVQTHHRPPPLRSQVSPRSQVIKLWNTLLGRLRRSQSWMACKWQSGKTLVNQYLRKQLQPATLKAILPSSFNISSGVLVLARCKSWTRRQRSWKWTTKHFKTIWAQASLLAKVYNLAIPQYKSWSSR